MVTYILIGIIVILIVLLILVLSKYLYYKEELYAQNDMFTYYKNKISMIEYHYRNYREGKNPFTVLRNIGDIIQDYYLKLGANKGDYDDRWC